MQGDNFDAAQLSVLAAPAKSLLLRDYQVSVGGPIKKDRMWFFFNHRRVGLRRRAARHLREQERRRPDQVDLLSLTSRDRAASTRRAGSSRCV